MHSSRKRKIKFISFTGHNERCHSYTCGLCRHCWFIHLVVSDKPDRIPRTGKTVAAICLRSLPLFFVFFLICRSFNISALFGLAVLAFIGFITFTSFSDVVGLPGIILFYAMQQWILGWPDRSLLVNSTSIESHPNKSDSCDLFTGRSAIVVRPLHPTGKVSVDGKELDAFCEFGFLEAGRMVEIIGKRNFTFLVKPKQKNS